MAKMYEATVEIIQPFTVRFEAESQKDAESTLCRLKKGDIDMILFSETVEVESPRGPLYFLVIKHEDEIFNLSRAPGEMRS